MSTHRLTILTLLAVLLAVPRPAAALTVNADLVADTLWGIADSPVDVTANVSVPAGVTLTIAPGVLVRFAQFCDLTVEGTILARGTPTAGITFTGSTPTVGWWNGLNLESNGATPNRGSIFEHVTIEYGGAWYANLYLYFAEATVRDSVIRFSAQDGIYTDFGGVPRVRNTAFTDNTGYPIQIYDGNIDPDLRQLTASGNAADVVYFYGGTPPDQTALENPGLPYVVAWSLRVAEGNTVWVEPGVELRFDTGADLTAYGRLRAHGTAAEPILFTGTTQTPGWWSGITITPDLGTVAEGSVFEHVTIEYGGSYYANLYVNAGRVHVKDSVIRLSSADGINTVYSGGSVIERSEFVDNAQLDSSAFDLRNETNDLVWAQYNWWGDAAGPTEPNCNPTGSGSTVSGYVAFTPFLNAAGQLPGPADPGEARLLSVEPLRWYAPADNLTRVWVELTLRDGAGMPLPGRTVRLLSSLGHVEDGGITDITGRTFATLSSDIAGDAELQAALELESTCEIAQSPRVIVTFTPGVEDAVLPEGEAPYLSSQIEIDPLPIARGVPTTLRATLVNPSDQPIEVDATFSFAQFGIGLTFGPAGQVLAHRINANSESQIEVQWTPLVAGHYCAQLEYTAHYATPRLKQLFGSGSSQRNLEVTPGPLGSSREKEDLSASKRIVNGLSKAATYLTLVTSPAAVIGNLLPDIGIGAILDFNFTHWTAASKALGSDPPRQDYDVYATVASYAFTPMTSGGGFSPARTDAANAMMTAVLDATANLQAATISLDRYAGAAADDDLLWSSQQAAAYLHYKKEAGAALTIAADRIDAFLAVLRNEGIDDLILEAQTYADYQTRLNTTGFTAEEIDAARLIGISDERLDEILQERLAADPQAEAGSVMQRLADTAEVSRRLGATLQDEANYSDNSSFQIGAANDLVRVYDATSTVRIGNPRATTETVELAVRRIDVPADWMTTVSPRSVVLQAGEAVDVSVTIRATSPAVQGTKARVAVEGRIAGELIGGIVRDVLLARRTQVGSNCAASADGAEEAACDCPMDCSAGLVCAIYEGARACRVACVPGGGDCALDQICEPMADGSGAICRLAGPESPPGGDDGGCGCAGSPVGLAALAALALLRRRWTGHRRLG